MKLPNRAAPGLLISKTPRGCFFPFPKNSPDLSKRQSVGLLLLSLAALTIAVFIGSGLFVPQSTSAFPPYRLTDAETADPWTFEGRMGLIRIEHEARQNAYASPLLRVNLGLPHNLEFISEFEYRPDEGQVGDAVVGLKWIPLMQWFSVGVETLALLPVLHQHQGAGVEASLLATLRVDALRVHINAGGFSDARPAVSESGWKSGTIVEVRLGSLRPGVELFAKQVESRPVQILVGPGLIIDAGPFDLRVGLHVGLTQEATDLTPSFWITSKLPLRSLVN